jgi:hypothetical protein
MQCLWLGGQEDSNHVFNYKNGFGVEYIGYTPAYSPFICVNVNYSRQLLKPNKGYYLAPHIGVGYYSFRNSGPFVKLGISAMAGRRWIYAGLEVDGFFEGANNELGARVSFGPKFLVLKRILKEPSIGVVYGKPIEKINHLFLPSHSLKTSFWF